MDSLQLAQEPPIYICFLLPTISHEAFTVAVAVHVTDSHVTICDTGF